MKKRMKKVLSFLLAGVLAFGSLSGISYAAAGTKPADGTTQEQPFVSGTGGSRCFRIPCFVTLDDGTLVAGCDARWTWNMDGGGLDTIVSHSKDNGKTWNYTFANYLGDNGNVANYGSTAFIDPAMATDGKNIYLVADLYSAGVALNGANYAPKPGHTGYNDKHELVLAKAEGNKNASADTVLRAAASFEYHLEKIEGAEDHAAAYYQLTDREGNPVDGYTIDALFNIKGDGVDTNLFCGDSPYFPYPTDFLYMTKSEDGGATWSIPTLIDVKKEAEQSLLVGPGRGIVTSTGRILFTAYEFTNGDKNSVCFYSDDEGMTWERGASVSSWSSEAVVTEADGKLYMFTRHGGYYVSDDMGATWSDRMEMGITYNLNCQLSAITYSEKIDGKTAIIFSAPSDAGSRAAGKLFTGLVQEDGTIRWAYEYRVNGNASYAYSCLDECTDGSIGLLYEGGDHPISYTNIAIEDIAKGAAIGGLWLTDAENNATTFALMRPGDTSVFNVNGLEDGAAVTVESSDENVVTASYADGVVKVAAKATSGLKEVKVIVKSGEETAVLNIQVTDSENFEKVTLAMGDTVTYTDETGNYANTDLSSVDTAVAAVDIKGEDYEAGSRKAEAQFATAAANFNGDIVNVEDCLYTFTAADGNNNYIISGTDVNGKTAYLSHRASSAAGIPSTANSSVITAEYNSSKAAFSMKDNATSGGGQYLYFHRSNTSKLHFDRQSGLDDNTYFELYKASESALADSPIMGYEKVSQITAGEKYLIAAPAADGNYYVLRPFIGGSNFNHVAKIVKPEVPMNGKTTITITGVSEGETSVTVGDVTYFIFVKNEVRDLTLKAGETFIAPGKLLSEVTGNVISVEKNGSKPPYAAVSEKKVLEGGNYLIGMGNYVMVSRDGHRGSADPAGRGMDLVNLKTDDLTDKMWTVTKVTDGYTIKDQAGKYLTFSGTSVILSETPQTLQIEVGTDDCFGVYNGTMYLNNYGVENTLVAGYVKDANALKWNFYAPVDGYVITAENPGRTEIVIGGVTYRITVEGETPELKTYTAYVDGEFYATGDYNERVDLHAEAAKDGKDFVCWMASSTADGEKAVVSLKPEYTFYLANDVYLTAVYGEKTIDPAATLVNTIAIPAADGKVNARFVGQLTVPEGASVKRAGLVWSTKDTPKELKLDAEGVKVTDVKSVNNAYQFSVTINGMPKDRFVRGVVFAEIVLADGTTGNIFYSVEGTITN